MRQTIFARLVVVTVALLGAAISVPLQSQDTRPTFKSDVREVSVVFRVVDRQNRVVAGITPSDIQIDDEGVPRNITSFRANVAHAQVVVLADVSGSMISVLEPLQGALYTFADLVSKDFDREPGDVLLSLVPFGDTATMLIDRTSNPTEFKEAVMRLRPSGATALVDSVLAILTKAFGDKEVSNLRQQAASPDDSSPISSRFRPRPASSGIQGTRRSKFLVIFTDAGENASTHRWSEIGLALLGKDIVIYTVAFDSGAPDSDFPMLSKITLQSGGKVHRARADALGRVYAEIAEDIRSHYQLTFTASGIENPRSWRNLRLSTNRPGVAIFARAGYCPDAPCQKPDGSFVGGRPRTWSEILALSRDPGVIYSVRQRLGDLRFEYTLETEKIVRDLAAGPLLIEKVWNPGRKLAGKTEGFSLVTRKADKQNQLVNMDAEVCGIALNPEATVPPQTNVPGEHPFSSSIQSVLTVINPEIRIARRPGSAQQDSTDVTEEVYFQSQAIFYLKDASGRIAPRLRVQCNRPHFLISEDLVQFAARALQHGLKVRSSSAR